MFDSKMTMYRKFGFDFIITPEPFILCYDPTPEELAVIKAAEEKAAADKVAADKIAAAKQFTQEDVNRLLAADRRKADDKMKKTLDELEAQRAKSSLSASERADLDTTIETLQNSLMTEKELTAKENAKSKKVNEKILKEVSDSRDQWQSLYTESTIERAIVDASSLGKNKAFNNSQIVAILKPNTRLVEELKDGEKTGKLVPMVKFSDTDKDGKPVTLDLAVSAAVKRMRELDEYANLFEGDGPGGMGKTNTSKGTQLDESAVAQMAKGDPGAYRKARKDGKLVF